MFKSKKKGPVKGFLLGGPAYQNLVDSRHAGSMVALAVRCQQLGYRTGSLYTHACPVEMARNEIMRQALATDFTWLVSADSDVWWPIETMDLIVWAAGELARLDQPMMGFAVGQRDGVCNVVAEGTEGWQRLTQVKRVQELAPCKAVGTGLVVFRLKWYRENWIKAPWFRTSWEGEAMTGEDFWHCGELKRRGAQPMYSAALEVKHALRGTL